MDKNEMENRAAAGHSSCSAASQLWTLGVTSGSAEITEEAERDEHEQQVDP